MIGFADGKPPGATTDGAPAPSARTAPALSAGQALESANLYAVLELIAGLAARASTARQYRSIYARFANALREELGRPPRAHDVTPDAIAAYSRDLERHGGHGGR